MIIELNCKASVITLRYPKIVWEAMKETLYSVSEWTFDAKLTKMEQIKMDSWYYIIKCSKKIASLENELSYF